MPRPNEGESKKDFLARFMSSEEAKKSFPDEKQRYVVALSFWKKYGTSKECIVGENVKVFLESSISAGEIIDE